MTTYNTGNPIGSKDPRDLYDNAENLDEAVNTRTAESWDDRFGVARKTWWGMEREFNTDQASRDNRFNTFIASSGYQFLGDYAAGIEITEYNQIIRDADGEFWRLSGQVELPYTTTGAGLPEDDALTPLGDAVLRQDLDDENQGAALVGFKQNIPSSVGRTVGEKLKERKSTFDISSDEEGLHQTAANLDADRARYMYIPNYNTDITVTRPVTIEYPGVRIFGDQGGTYNRGLGKKGWLRGAEGLSHIIDLGNSRSTASGSVNPADNWQVDGISLTWETQAARRQVDGIRFTSRTNGPDRGAIIRDTSFIGLKDAITIENPDVSVTIADLDVQNCVFANNGSAVNAKGRVFGMRFVGNQCEQNTGSDGIIRGYLCGPITINDNMLEGQPNPINIDTGSPFGEFTQMESKGNYFEANTGEYIYRIGTTVASSVFHIGPNYNLNLQTDNYILAQSAAAGGAAVVVNHDPYPVTFDNSNMTLSYGSDIFPSGVSHYRIRRLRGANAKSGPTIYIKDFMSLEMAENSAVFSLGVPTPSPLGLVRAGRMGGYVTLGLSCEEGDVIAFNVMLFVPKDTGDQVLSILDDDNVVIRSFEHNLRRSENKWVLWHKTLSMPRSSDSLRFRIGTLDDRCVIGVSATNLGKIGLTYEDVTEITPQLPAPTYYFPDPPIE